MAGGGKGLSSIVELRAFFVGLLMGTTWYYSVQEIVPVNISAAKLASVLYCSL